MSGTYAEETRTVGQRIRSARLRAGLSLDELTRRGAPERSHLIKIEQGRTEPGHKTLARIAAALEMSVVELADEQAAMDWYLDLFVRTQPMVQAYVREYVREALAEGGVIAT